MSAESATLTEVDRVELSLRILEFIGRTTDFVDAMARISTGPWEPLVQPEDIGRLILASRDTINGCLQETQGLPGKLDDPDSGTSTPVILRHWHGIDPTDPAKHVWTVDYAYALQPPQVLSMRADEVHQDVLGLLGISL